MIHLGSKAFSLPRLMLSNDAAFGWFSAAISAQIYRPNHIHYAQISHPRPAPGSENSKYLGLRGHNGDN